MAINIDADGFDEGLRQVFHEGVTLDSPDATFSYNTDPKERGNSSLTMRLRIQGPHINDGVVDSADINRVKQLAYTFLQNKGLLEFNLTGDVYVRVKLKEISVSPIEGTDIWNVSCKYTQGPTDSDQSVYLSNFAFSTSAQTAHITQSLATMVAEPVNKYAVNSDGSIAHHTNPVTGMDTGVPVENLPWNFWNGIGYQDGEYQGVDVFRPAMRFTKDVWIAETLLTFSIMRNFAKMTGTVNADMFCGFEPGEVLFKGVSNSSRSKITAGNMTIYYWALTLEFECQPNGIWTPPNQDKQLYYYNGYWYTLNALMDTMVYDPTTGSFRIKNPTETAEMNEIYQAALANMLSIPKRGWDYFWALYETVVTEDTSGNRRTIKRPIQYNVEQVYPYESFCPFFGFGYEDGYVTNMGLTPFQPTL